MIIFLYGVDSYRSRKKLEEIVDHYKQAKKSGLNLRYLDASQADFADFYNSFRTSSMFDEKKLVIVKNVFASKKFQEELLPVIKELESLKDVVVLYEPGEAD